jgi:hypothetical protein
MSRGCATVDQTSARVKNVALAACAAVHRDSKVRRLNEESRVVLWTAHVTDADESR